MTALAHQDTIRESRVYRVNAWREYKGRPALSFEEQHCGEEKAESGGTDWFTSRPPISADEIRRGVGKAISRATLIAPPTAKQYREWEAIYTQKGR